MYKYIIPVIAICFSIQLSAQTKIPFSINDLDSMKDVSSPKISPDEKWVAYAVSSINSEKDYYTSDIWMTSWDGENTIQLTNTEEADETLPKWSPDNKYISFLSSRKSSEDDDEDISQVWIMNRMGGEAEKITDFPGGVEDYAWSPDGSRIALIVNIDDTSKYIPGTETAKPIVIDRFYFKEDYSGYLTTSRKHLYVFNMDTEDTMRIVDGNYEEELPSWSPDGKRIAFISKRSQTDFDRNNNYDIYVVDVIEHAQPLQLTTTEGADGDPSYESPPVWSPDGKYIAYFEGGPLKYLYYGTQNLAIVPSTGGAAKVLTAKYDRNIWMPKFSADGSEIYFLAEDDQNLELNKISVNGGTIKHVINGRYTIYEYDIAKNKLAVSYSTPNAPLEIFAVDENKSENILRPLSKQNDDFISRRIIATTKEFISKSKDGTMVSGFMVLPVNYTEGIKYPTILQIHGGPTSQNQNEWYFDWQLYAAWGYATVSMNPRGSTTKGQDYALGIFAKWGTVDIEDDLSGVDYLIEKGIADPNKLAVEGWSYGGIATDYTIYLDHRFKCAISGASIGNAFAGYGTDMYVREYEAELGTPWKNFDNYVQNSLPFLHADQITTPTLFMCGENDFNVPLINSEQMYQALKSLHIETQLIIYPDQFHGLDIPSYLRDRFERRKNWFGKYIGD